MRTQGTTRSSQAGEGFSGNAPSCLCEDLNLNHSLDPDLAFVQSREIMIKRKITIKSLYQNEFLAAVGRARHSVRAGLWLAPNGAHGVTRPTTNCHFDTRPKTGGFTLIELLIAVTIFGIVLVAINTVFFSGLYLQRTTNRVLDETAPVQQAFAMLRRDLQGTAQPNTNATLLRKDFICGAQSSSFASSGAGTLDFYTTTGNLSDSEPWSELQRVVYQLVDPAERTATTRGKELVRNVERNVLPVSTDEFDTQFVMGDVESIEFECFDGTGWRTTWDTTGANVGLPQAVRVKILMAQENNNRNSRREPLQLLVPIVTQARTNTTTVAGGGA